MAKQILVPITKNDRVEELIPYVERVAHPGMKVVFLFRYPVAGFMWRDLGTKELAENYSLDGNLQRANQRVLPACEVLAQKGVEVAVSVYTGSLRRAVRNYALKGKDQLIMQRPGLCHMISRCLNNIISALPSPKGPSPTPVLPIAATCWRD